MNRNEAISLLNPEDPGSTKSIEDAHRLLLMDLEERIVNAPTESLREKYKKSIADANEALNILQLLPKPPKTSLSSTQINDLPLSAQHLTALGATNADIAAVKIEEGKTLAERYEVKMCIGMGGMGAVYSAYDKMREKVIALKVLLPNLLENPEAKTRFLNEARIASELSHPNIVNVFDVNQDGNLHFITMELLDGQTLREVMDVRKQTHQSFELDEVRKISDAMCDALFYAHDFTVHRDIKPENIFICDDGTVKIMDFGVARLLGTSQLTTTGVSMGTAYYMAPEQLQAGKETDQRVDQYAIGVVLYELLTGELPLGKMRGIREFRKDVPGNIEKAIERALAARPDDRYKSVKELSSQIAENSLSLFRLNKSAGKWLVGFSGIAALVFGLVFVMQAPSNSEESIHASGSRNSLSNFWVSIFGDPEKERQLRQRTLELEGRVASLRKRIDKTEEELQERVKTAEQRVSKYENAMRSARNEEDRATAAKELEEYKIDFSRYQELANITAEIIFGSNSLSEADGKIAAAQAALEQGDMASAHSGLVAAENLLAELLDAPEEIESILESRDQLRARLNYWGVQALSDAKEFKAQVYSTGKGVDAADIELSKENYQVAKRIYLKADTELKGAEITYLLNLAELQIGRGSIFSPEKKNAIISYQEVLSLDLQNEVARRGLGDIKDTLLSEAAVDEKSGRWSKALGKYKAVEKISDDPTIRDYIGRAQAGLDGATARQRREAQARRKREEKARLAAEQEREEERLASIRRENERSERKMAELNCNAKQKEYKFEIHNELGQRGIYYINDDRYEFKSNEYFTHIYTIGSVWNGFSCVEIPMPRWEATTTNRGKKSYTLRKHSKYNMSFNDSGLADLTYE